MDLRLYKRIQLFTHAERLVNDVAEELKDGDFSVFMRLGTDVKSNFYEYEVPLHLTAPGKYNTHNTNDQYAAVSHSLLEFSGHGNVVGNDVYFCRVKQR